MDGAGANRLLIAREGGGEERSGLEASFGDQRMNVIGGFARAARRQRAAEFQQRRRERRGRQRNRLAGQHGDAARELGARYFGGSDSRGGRSRSTVSARSTTSP